MITLNKGIEEMVNAVAYEGPLPLGLQMLYDKYLEQKADRSPSQPAALLLLPPLTEYYEGVLLKKAAKERAKKEMRKHDIVHHVFTHDGEGAWENLYWVKASTAEEAVAKVEGFAGPAHSAPLPGYSFTRRPYFEKWDRARKAYKVSQSGGLDI